DGRLLSTIASPSTKPRAGAGMKMRPPVDRDLTVVEPGAPFAQGPGRQKQRVGVLARAHPAPVQRLHVHRPERLAGPRAHVRPRPQPGPRLRGLLALPPPLLPAQFSQFFGMIAGFFDADEMLHPASERLPLKPVPGAVFGAAQAAPAPCFDVQRPVWAVCICPRTSVSHSEILQCAKNPDVTRQCSLGQVCRPRTLTTRPTHSPANSSL